MSQQINLLLPELRPRFDWMALPVVAAVAMVVLVLTVAMGSFAALKVNQLKAQDAELGGQLLGLQQQIQSLGQSLAARQGDPGLPAEIAATRLGVTQRQEVMAVIGEGSVGDGSGFSGLLQGFSRQVVDGVWLTGFSLAVKDVEIRGRLTDPSLLPVYINRLNDEPAFAGRRFASLDMKGVDPANDKSDAVEAASKVKPGNPYTEFALRTEPVKSGERGK